MTQQAGSGTGVVHVASDELLDEFDATVQMLGRLFSARHGEMCCETGLSTSQMLTMRVLDSAGPVRLGDVASHVGIKAPAASAIVDALEKRGFVHRESDPEDRRATLLSLTDAGRESLVESEAERREHMRRYLSLIAEDDLRTLIRVHTTLIEAMASGRV